MDPPMLRKGYFDYIHPLFELLPLLVIAFSFLHSLELYPKLPSMIPVHFDIRGLPNRWAAKTPATAFGMNLVQSRPTWPSLWSPRPSRDPGSQWRRNRSRAAPLG